jgi:hypothetical protein
MQLICPCLIARKDLMTKFYPAAVGDTTRTRVRQSPRRDAGHDISAHQFTPGGTLDRPGVFSRAGGDPAHISRPEKQAVTFP